MTRLQRLHEEQGLVVDDVLDALNVLRPTFDASDGGNGFVSIEVAPELAHDVAGTIRAARDLHERTDRPNLFVKIPATSEGVDAIQAMIAEAHSKGRDQVAKATTGLAAVGALASATGASRAQSTSSPCSTRPSRRRWK